MMWTTAVQGPASALTCRRLVLPLLESHDDHPKIIVHLSKHAKHALERLVNIEPAGSGRSPAIKSGFIAIPQHLVSEARQERVRPENSQG